MESSSQLDTEDYIHGFSGAGLSDGSLKRSTSIYLRASTHLHRPTPQRKLSAAQAVKTCSPFKAITLVSEVARVVAVDRPVSEVARVVVVDRLVSEVARLACTGCRANPPLPLHNRGRY